MRMIRSRRPVVVLAVTFALGGLVSGGATAFAQATGQSTHAQASKARYTNASNVKKDCAVHWNYPKQGLPDLQWQAGPSTGSKTVGVRYTAGSYALILDYGRAPRRNPARSGQFPWWGWIHKSCLVDPVARHFPDGTPGSKDRRDAPDADGFAYPLPNRKAVGGNNRPKTVNVSPSHRGQPRKTIHFGSGGTLRSGPKQFAIGNVQDGWEFHITRDKCRTLDGSPFKTTQWVFGYAPQAGRWGWAQASHLPACTG